MKLTLKFIGILLLIVFLLWNIIIFAFSGFGGCPPAYAVEKIHYNPNILGNVPASNIHLTDQDLIARPYLREAFEDEKWILLPVGTITDFFPGNYFGPKYAIHRMPLWDREYFVNTVSINQNSVWEYNGTYIKFFATTC